MTILSKEESERLKQDELNTLEVNCCNECIDGAKDILNLIDTIDHLREKVRELEGKIPCLRFSSELNGGEMDINCDCPSCEAVEEPEVVLGVRKANDDAHMQKYCTCIEPDCECAEMSLLKGKPNDR